jgi:hypothetical protein
MDAVFRKAIPTAENIYPIFIPWGSHEGCPDVEDQQWVELVEILTKHIKDVRIMDDRAARNRRRLKPLLIAHFVLRVTIFKDI